VEPWVREAIINRSLRHIFTQTDFDAIGAALARLDGKSNRAAWAYLREFMPAGQRRLQLAGVGTTAYTDAIDDLGTDNPAYVTYTGRRYARDPNVRAAVLQRARGRCEYCGEMGFKCDGGTRYLECHHILALADEGEDRMTNVIAICPGDHREAHFGKRRNEMEVEMIAKVRAAEERRLSGQAT
jgi:hypothetical protein